MGWVGVGGSRICIKIFPYHNYHYLFSIYMHMANLKKKRVGDRQVTEGKKIVVYITEHTHFFIYLNKFDFQAINVFQKSALHYCGRPDTSYPVSVPHTIPSTHTFPISIELLNCYLLWNMPWLYKHINFSPRHNYWIIYKRSLIPITLDRLSNWLFFTFLCQVCHTQVKWLSGGYCIYLQYLYTFTNY